MSLPSQRKAVIDSAKAINDELCAQYPGARTMGAGEIAEAIRMRCRGRKKASTASIANALRNGTFHDGRKPRAPIEHPTRRIWDVPIGAVALNIAELIEGIAHDVSVADILSQWHVVRIEPMEPDGAITQERVVLDYRLDMPSDPERPDAADVDAFLDAVGAEIQRLDRMARATKDRRVLRGVAGLDP